MIRRGSLLSRVLALSIVFGPLSIALIAFTIWAIDSWLDSGARIAAAERLRHEALARAAQARLYGPLGEAWRDYAQTDLSGLLQAQDGDAAERLMIDRMETLLERVDAGAPTITPLPTSGDEKMEQLRVETRAEIREADLPTLMQAIEAEAPFMFVDRFEATRVSGGAHREQMRLAIRLRITTFRLKNGVE